MDRSEMTKRLASVPLFARLEPHDLDLVAARMKEVHFEPGRAIAKQGDSGVGFHLIVDGEAEVSGDGVPRHTIGAGGYFGEIGLIDGGPRSATVTATSDLTTVSLVGWDFTPLLDNPSFTKGLLMGLCKIARQEKGG
jgi:CRP/FNR family cyclic AMP-dependent transcriptional regulator